MLSFLWSGHWRLSTSGRRRFPNEKCWHKSTNNWLLRISVHGSKCLFALHRNILKGTTFYNELKSTMYWIWIYFGTIEYRCVYWHTLWQNTCLFKNSSLTKYCSSNNLIFCAKFLKLLLNFVIMKCMKNLNFRA